MLFEFVFSWASCIFRKDALPLVFSLSALVVITRSVTPRWRRSSEPALQCRRCRFDPWVGRIPWRRERQPLLFLPGESLGRRSLAGCSPWGRKKIMHDSATNTLPKSLTAYTSASLCRKEWFHVASRSFTGFVALPVLQVGLPTLSTLSD